MVMDVYNGYIGVPAKCGSRFFKKTISEWGEPIRSSFRNFYTGVIKLNCIIIRNPATHLKSALQTEIMECSDNHNEIETILKSYTDTYNGGTHFYPQFCEKIYNIWYRNNYDLKIVDLSNLSEFISSILYDIPYDETEFDFKWSPNFKTKDEIWNICVELYPELMNKLIAYTQSDMKYYNALLNRDDSLVKDVQLSIWNTKKFL